MHEVSHERTDLVERGPHMAFTILFDIIRIALPAEQRPPQNFRLPGPFEASNIATLARKVSLAVVCIYLKVISVESYFC